MNKINLEGKILAKRLFDKVQTNFDGMKSTFNKSRKSFHVLYDFVFFW